MALPPINPGWTVTDQREGMEQAQGGQIVRGMRIYFTTTAGHGSSIFVPAALYANVDYVRSQLADAAAAVSTVGQLSG